MAYAPPTPRRFSNQHSYGDSPPMHTPLEQPAYLSAAAPLQQQQQQQQQQHSAPRARNTSDASQRSQHSPYLPHPHQQPQPQQQQQLTPYAQPQQQPQQQAAYFPPTGAHPPGTQLQLHPDMYAQPDPFAHRQRRESATSHHSHHSQRSQRSVGSRRGGEHWTGRRDGQRATLGDSLFGIWSALRDMIPTSRR